MSTNADVYSRITAQLIAAIEANPNAPTLPWRQDSTAAGLPRNALTGKSYSGVNVVALWVASSVNGFGRPLWASYRQWTELGAQVRRGERSSTVVFYREYDFPVAQADEPTVERRRVARAFNVFNADQVVGFAPEPEQPPHVEPMLLLDEVERLVARTKADIRYGGDRAFYQRAHDFIQMPERDRFISTASMPVVEAYYSTLLHELVHWTGAAARLDRSFGKRFGDEAYAAEELVAEIGASFLCAELGVSPAVREDHAGYLSHWLNLLKRDSRVIFTASSRAADATRFLQAFGVPTAGAKTLTQSAQNDAE